MQHVANAGEWRGCDAIGRVARVKLMHYLVAKTIRCLVMFSHVYGISSAFQLEAIGIFIDCQNKPFYFLR